MKQTSLSCFLKAFSRRLFTARAALGAPILLLGTWLSGCDNADLGERVAQGQGQSFGAVFYREACQRVAYSDDLMRLNQTPFSTIDMSGVQYRALCMGEEAANASLPLSLQTLDRYRPKLVSAIDTVVPEARLTLLDRFLIEILPLQDDGTLKLILDNTNEQLRGVQQNRAVMEAAARLDHASAMTSAAYSGALLRSLAANPFLEKSIDQALPMMAEQGTAHESLKQLAGALSFELRHLTQNIDPVDPNRSTALVKELALSRHPELIQNKPLLLTLRDEHRGLPKLSQITAPYVKDNTLADATGLAQATTDGQFIDSAGQPIPYVTPFAKLGEKDSAARDTLGRALNSSKRPLYQSVDLDGTLLYALLQDARTLFASHKIAADGQSQAAMDIPFALARGGALLLGTQSAGNRRVKEGDTFTYQGFSADGSVALDAAHGALSLMKFQTQDGANNSGAALRTVLLGMQTLMNDPALEPKLARALKGFLDIADEIKKPEYDALTLPKDSTLFDDLIPLVARMSASEGLMEDLMEALKDPHTQNLWPMLGTMMQERGRFFMKQPSNNQDLVNGVDPFAADAASGQLGALVNRAEPDSDANLDWRSGDIANAQNNRSIFQRLLNVIGDVNGKKPFCNSKNAQLFGGFVVGSEPCDAFKIDNVAQFFLLSLATHDGPMACDPSMTNPSPNPARCLRSRDDTFAKPVASFQRALENGNYCQCGKIGTPVCLDVNAASKCSSLKALAPDGGSGDSVLSGLTSIKDFGRYPAPQASARLLFMDLGTATFTPPYVKPAVRGLVYNHIKTGPTTYEVDSADTDSRKFIDGNGRERLFIDEHNGVLFALEKITAKEVRGAAIPFPNDNVYDAMRPLVDAFAKHSECFQRDNAGVCTKGQNSVQIMADLLATLHRHWPSVQSRIAGRSFADSYGSQMTVDGLSRFEPLLAKLLTMDALPALADLIPVLQNLSVDSGAGPQKVLPIMLSLARFVVDPTWQRTTGFRYRDGQGIALRQDGQQAYGDVTLNKIAAAQGLVSVKGQVTPAYLLIDAFRKASNLFDRPENAAVKTRFKAAVSDAIDQFLQVKNDAGTYQFNNPRIRPVSALLLTFAAQRVAAHRTDMSSWPDELMSDVTDLVTGPLLSSTVDLMLRLDDNPQLRQVIYDFVYALLDDQNQSMLPALALTSADALQILACDSTALPVGKALNRFIDPNSGLLIPTLKMADFSWKLKLSSDVKLFIPILQALLTQSDPQNGDATYPLFHLLRAAIEVNRTQPGQESALSGDDVQSLLGTLIQFLGDQKRGLSRFIEIVQGREEI